VFVNDFDELIVGEDDNRLIIDVLENDEFDDDCDLDVVDVTTLRPRNRRNLEENEVDALVEASPTDEEERNLNSFGYKCQVRRRDDTVVFILQDPFFEGTARCRYKACDRFGNLSGERDRCGTAIIEVEVIWPCPRGSDNGPEINDVGVELPSSADSLMIDVLDNDDFEEGCGELKIDEVVTLSPDPDRRKLEEEEGSRLLGGYVPGYKCIKIDGGSQVKFILKDLDFTGLAVCEYTACDVRERCGTAIIEITVD